MSVEALLGTDRVFADGPAGAAARIPARRHLPRNLRALLAGSGDRRQPPRSGLHARPGRVLAALLAPGRTGRPATRWTTPRSSPVASWRPRSTTRSSPSTAGSSPTATSTARRSATSSTSWRSPRPTWPSISERRTDRFLDVARNGGLPPFLADDPGVDSGHMIAQYTQAAIVSELKRLAAPGQRRLDPVQRDAGGPRLDGLERGAQAAPLGRRAGPRARRRDAHRCPRRSTCAPRCEPAAGTAAVRDAVRGSVAGPGPDRTSRPRSTPSSSLVQSRRRRQLPPKAHGAAAMTGWKRSGGAP